MRIRRDQIKVATFNLYNLILPQTPFYNNRQYSQEDYQKKKTWINRQLQAMDADIIGVQEVFQEQALRDVLKDNEEERFRKAHVLMVPSGDGTPSVGLISRFPITDYEVIRNFPEPIDVQGMQLPFARFSRPILKAKVQLSSKLSVYVFVAHLKSKRPVFPEDQFLDRDNPLEVAKGQARSLLLRASEAYALRMTLMSVLQNRDCPVIVLGDLNDAHTSVTTQIISGEPPFRYLPLEKKLRHWDVLLYHVKDIQARMSYHDTYYTHIHNGHYESLDHIMVSQEWVRENPKHIGRVGFVRIFNDHLVDKTLSNDPLPVWVSDHAQVVASIELNDPLDA